jgi:UPF0716 protein FxsA
MPTGLIAFHVDARQPWTAAAMPPIGLIFILILVAFPLLELALLLKAGAVFGVGPVLLIVIVTFILGITVVRQQGLGVARRYIEATRSGKPPVEPLVEGMLLFMAGGCLIAPGLITDTIGLILLIPPLRQWVARWIAANRFAVVDVTVTRDERSKQARNSTGVGPTIEGDFERLDEKPGPPPHSKV